MLCPDHQEPMSLAPQTMTLRCPVHDCTRAITRKQELLMNEKDVIPLPIKGYRNLTESEISLINKLKELGIVLGIQVDELYLTPGVDQRWTSIGKTHLQEGMMALIRAVARPETF